jgi:hypothetical protein
MLEYYFFLQESILPFTCTENCVNDPVAAFLMQHRIQHFFILSIEGKILRMTTEQG